MERAANRERATSLASARHMMYVMYMMVRKQLYLSAAQDRALKRRARALGVTEAEVVRAALDETLGARAHAEPERPGRARALASLLGRLDDVSRSRTAPIGRWSREELYDERERRWTRGRSA